jgi:hypothetical protein
MGFFNFVETFFFISLAITFVLIMMLIYHFKERLSTLENKTEKIMEIVNNLFNELTKQIAIINSLRLQINSNIDSNIDSINQIQSNTQNQNIRLVVSDNEEDSDDYDSDEYISEDDYEEDEKAIKHIQIHLSEKVDTDFNDSVVELTEPTDSIEVTEPTEPTEPLESTESTDNLDIDINEIIVKKIDESVDNESDNESDEKESENKSVNINPVEVYRKMDIVELRALVIQQGLATDVKKIKKVELIRLLTNTLE